MKNDDELDMTPEQRPRRSGAVVTFGRSRGVAQPTAVPEPDDLQALARNGSEVALRSLTPVAGLLRQAAKAFRAGDAVNANRDMTQGVLTLRGVAVVTGLLTLAPAEAGGSTHDVDALFERMGAALDTLASRQQTGDSVGIANVLERDLMPLLEPWSALLTAIYVKGTPVSTAA